MVRNSPHRPAKRPPKPAPMAHLPMSKLPRSSRPPRPTAPDQIFLGVQGGGVVRVLHTRVPCACERARARPDAPAAHGASVARPPCRIPRAGPRDALQAGLAPYSPPTPRPAHKSLWRPLQGAARAMCRLALLASGCRRASRRWPGRETPETPAGRADPSRPHRQTAGLHHTPPLHPVATSPSVVCNPRR